RRLRGAKLTCDNDRFFFQGRDILPLASDEVSQQPVFDVIYIGSPLAYVGIFYLGKMRGDIAQRTGNGELGSYRFGVYHIGYFLAKSAVPKIAEVDREDVFHLLPFDFLLLGLKLCKLLDGILENVA